VAPVRRLPGLRLAVAALEAQAQGDLTLELGSRAFEQGEPGARVDARGRLGPGCAQDLAPDTSELGPQLGSERRSGAAFGEGFDPLGGSFEGTEHIIRRSSSLRGLLQQKNGLALMLEQAGPRRNVRFTGWPRLRARRGEGAHKEESPQEHGTHSGP
jgi:hypothetical protein